MVNRQFQYLTAKWARWGTVYDPYRVGAGMPLDGPVSARCGLLQRRTGPPWPPKPYQIFDYKGTVLDLQLML